MDDLDKASESEQIMRDASIAHARRVIPIHERPALGCFSCQGITQSSAKLCCEHYANCMTDWTKEQRMKEINGKGE